VPKETIDLVTRKPNGAYVMVLVEQGPWSEAPEVHLRGIQERLYNYVDIAVDGHLARLHADSGGKDVVIRVDAYDTPPGEVSGLVERFAAYIGTSKEIRDAIDSQRYVRAIDFECSERELP